MRTSSGGFRVVVVGASSLQGKELMAVLEERKFPVSRLVTFATNDEEPDLPIVDLRRGAEVSTEDSDVTEADLDLAFLAARPLNLPAFLRPGSDGDEPGGCFVIDLGEALAEVTGLAVSAPSLDGAPAAVAPASPDRRGRFIVSAYPATIAICRLLLPLAARYGVRTALAHIFVPASHSGPRAIEELQKQTVNLLSFQKLPSAVFGAQLAFNLLPRLGRQGQGGFAALAGTIRNQLRQLLNDRVPLPALRVTPAPVFYSTALSLHVELTKAVRPENIARAIAGGAGSKVRVRHLSEPPPSPVEATGAGEILLDAVVPDEARPGGFWLWAALDNLRLAAENAVQIAEGLLERVRRDTRATPTVHGQRVPGGGD